MSVKTIGILSPGDMGHVVGKSCRAADVYRFVGTSSLAEETPKPGGIAPDSGH